MKTSMHRLPAHYLFRSYVVVALVAIAGCASINDTDFGSFLENFSKSKAFSVEHTLYPLKVTRIEYGIEGSKEITNEEVTLVSKAQDASTPTLAENLKAKNLIFTEKNRTPTTAIVEVAVPDTDWLLTYHFVLRNQRWFLEEIRDYSL